MSNSVATLIKSNSYVSWCNYRYHVDGNWQHFHGTAAIVIRLRQRNETECEWKDSFSANCGVNTQERTRKV